MPILLALVLMCKFKVKPAAAMLAALLTAVILAKWLWQMDITMLLAAAIRGTFISLDIIFIILGAILLLNVMRTSGAINS
ncbi:MAG: L-lactate permease, partial [Lentisphaeria bacterium]|nr:L-lactate permease [Lentisphaeria bacterium]